MACRLITLSSCASVSCHDFPPCHRLSCAILQVEHATQLHQAALGSFGCWRAGFVWLLAMRRRGAPNAGGPIMAGMDYSGNGGGPARVPTLLYYLLLLESSASSHLSPP